MIRPNGTLPERFASLEIVISDVSFGGVLGVGRTPGEGCSSRIYTPEHTAGPVDVSVSWTYGGIVQAPITHTGGFTFRDISAAPTITHPLDQAVQADDVAIFEVVASGSAQVSWEHSSDRGVSWEPILSDVDATVS